MHHFVIEELLAEGEVLRRISNYNPEILQMAAAGGKRRNSIQRTGSTVEVDRRNTFPKMVHVQAERPALHGGRTLE